MSLQVFKYQGTPITFNSENGVMANASQMAKAFGKLPADYIRLDSTKAFVGAWMEEYPDMVNPISVIKGGSAQGTWMHQDIALDFAQWLSPKFKVWCNARIKELLTTGKVELSDDDVVMKAFKVLTQRAEFQEQQIKLLDNTIQEQAPKVKYHDTVLQSTTLIQVDKIALQLGISAQKLNQILADKNVQFKRNGVWFLYTRYREKGLASYKTHAYTDSHGNKQTTQHLYWSEAGRLFIINLLQEKKKAA